MAQQSAFKIHHSYFDLIFSLITSDLLAYTIIVWVIDFDGIKNVGYGVWKWMKICYFHSLKLGHRFVNNWLIWTLKVWKAHQVFTLCYLRKDNNRKIDGFSRNSNYHSEIIWFRLVFTFYLLQMLMHNSVVMIFCTEYVHIFCRLRWLKLLKHKQAWSVNLSW